MGLSADVNQSGHAQLFCCLIINICHQQQLMQGLDGPL